MKRRFATFAASVLFISAFLAATPVVSSAAVLSFDGKVGKVSVSYMVYNGGQQRFVTKKLTFKDSFRSVSNNAGFTLTEATPFDVISGQMLVDTKVLITFDGTLLEVSKGLQGNVTCSGRILLDNGVAFNGDGYTGSGQVLEFTGANVVNIVAKTDSKGNILGVARLVITTDNAVVLTVDHDVVNPDPEPTKAMLKITPMRFQQTIIPAP